MDTNSANKTENYNYAYFTTLMVVLRGFIGDLFWDSDKVKHDNLEKMELLRLHACTLGNTC